MVGAHGIGKKRPQGHEAPLSYRVAPHRSAISATAAGDIRIGISGWRYKGWRGVFYPEKLPQHRELEFAAQQFRSVELNGSFYSLQMPSSFRKWADSTPEDFVFSVKCPRFITHMLKLRNIEQPLANFFASGV